MLRRFEQWRRQFVAELHRSLYSQIRLLVVCADCRSRAHAQSEVVTGLDWRDKGRGVTERDEAQTLEELLDGQSATTTRCQRDAIKAEYVSERTANCLSGPASFFLAFAAAGSRTKKYAGGVCLAGLSVPSGLGDGRRFDAQLRHSPSPCWSSSSTWPKHIMCVVRWQRGQV
jgi:hypothetical protein